MLDQLAPAATKTAKYEVRLDVFNGPLPLLLHLIQRRELDISLVSLASVTDQYIAYVQSLPEPDPDHLADFLVVAAKLLVIKALALIARPAEPILEEESDALDLVRALQEYRLFQAAAAQLKAWEAAERRAFPRLVTPTPIRLPGLDALSLDDLIAALRRHATRNAGLVEQGPRLPKIAFSVADKIATIESCLASREDVKFHDLLPADAPVLEVVVTFLALLELLKARHVVVRQNAIYGDITIQVKPPEPPDEAPSRIEDVTESPSDIELMPRQPGMEEDTVG